MAKRSAEPILWILFSAGGVAAAMLWPIVVLLFGLAFPLGWLPPPSYEHLRGLFGNPIVRVGLFVVCTLSLFHWAHRFRYTLYDGLQIKHLNEVVAVVSYGAAIVGSGLAAYLLWQVG
jgi:succinate dehydrogenase subunit D